LLVEGRQYHRDRPDHLCTCGLCIRERGGSCIHLDEVSCMVSFSILPATVEPVRGNKWRAPRMRMLDSSFFLHQTGHMVLATSSSRRFRRGHLSNRFPL